MPRFELFGTPRADLAGLALAVARLAPGAGFGVAPGLIAVRDADGDFLDLATAPRAEATADLPPEMTACFLAAEPDLVGTGADARRGAELFPLAVADLATDGAPRREPLCEPARAEELATLFTGLTFLVAPVTSARHAFAAAPAPRFLFSAALATAAARPVRARAAARRVPGLRPAAAFPAAVAFLDGVISPPWSAGTR